MNAWLYQRLNHEAKAWPYHVGNRPKQRESNHRTVADQVTELAVVRCSVWNR